MNAFRKYMTSAGGLGFATGLAVVLLALLLAGCGGVPAAAVRVTYGDAVRFTDENHQVRRNYRATKETIIAEMVQAYRNCATVAVSEGDFDKAEVCWAQALQLLGANYRDLATIEAVREGLANYGAFKRAIEDAKAPAS